MDRRSFSLGAALCAVLFASLALAAQAGAYIYWADAQSNTIGRAENDGSGVNPSFIQTGQGPGAVAVDSAHIYWANESAGTIGRANIDGSGVNNSFITGITQPNGVAVNGTSIYWSAFNGYIGKANLDGSSPQKTFISDPDGPTGVALDAGHVYWTAIGTGTPAYVGRASLDGFVKEPTFVAMNLALPLGLAVNTSNIYWADFGFGGGGTRIGSARTTNGGNVDLSFIGGGSGPCGVALSGLQLYWANDATNTIARANSDGTAVNQSFIETGSKRTCGVAVDSLVSPAAPPSGGGGGSGSGGPAGGGGNGGSEEKTPPQTTIARGPGGKLAEGLAVFRFKSSQPGSSFFCKLDRKKARSCRSPKSYRRLEPGRHVFKVWAVNSAGARDSTPAKRTFAVPAR